MKPRLSIQLWSVKDSLARDPNGTLSRLAAMGYEGVEPASDDPFAPEEMRRLFDRHGLVVSAAHGWLEPGVAFQAQLERQRILGNKRLVVPALCEAGTEPKDRTWEKFRDLDAIKRVAEEFSRAAERAATHGVQLGYHNHTWEFGADFGGRSGYEVFWDFVPAGVIAEIDVYWAKVAGRDPAQLIRALGARVELLHLKNGNGREGAPTIAVGEGVVDMSAVNAAALHCRWHTVEIEGRADDVFNVAEASARYLIENNFVESRATRQGFAK